METAVMRSLCAPPLLLFFFLLVSPVWCEPDFSTPRQAFETYLEACRQGDYQAADQCYTKSSREFLAANPEFVQGRDPEILKQTYQVLSATDFRLEQVNSKRAILHAADEKVPPMFLRRQAEGEGWRIDWHFMTHYIRADADGWSYRNPRMEKLWKSRE